MQGKGKQLIAGSRRKAFFTDDVAIAPDTDVIMPTFDAQPKKSKKHWVPE